MKVSSIAFWVGMSHLKLQAQSYSVTRLTHLPVESSRVLAPRTLLFWAICVSAELTVTSGKMESDEPRWEL